MKKYIVFIESVPGFYEQYSGNVHVFADNDEEAIEAALHKLETGAFRDRSRNMWRVKEVKRKIK